jgi:hypothetical protein
MYENDHPPLRVHVFRDSRLVARYDLEHRRFMEGSDERHFGRVLNAPRAAGLI